MGRINGANSDYKYNGSGVVEAISNPLYMKLYICPYGHLNPLEPPKEGKSLCIGKNGDCPGENGDKTGHAMIQLSQAEGVEIMAGNKNRILVKQNGEIELGQEGGAASIILKSNGEIVIKANTVTIEGNLAVTGIYPGK